MSENQLQKLFYSPQEAAEVLSLSRPHIYRLVKQGRIPAMRFGARVLIPHAEIMKMEFEAYPTNPIAEE